MSHVMDCRTLFTRPGARAFSLFEVMIAMAVASLVAVTLAALGIYFSRSLSMVMNHIDIEAQSRVAMDTMSREIRRATSVTGLTTNSITLRVKANRVTYAINATDRTLTRVERDSLGSVLDTRVFLRECNSASFETYQRNATNATYNTFPSATTRDAKIVRLRWSLSRTNYSNKLVVGTMNSARIVIRKKST